MGRTGPGRGVGTAVGEGSGGRVGSAGGGSGVAGVGIAGVGVTVGVGWPRMREIGAHGARANGAIRSRPTIRQVSIGFRRRFNIVPRWGILTDGG